MLTVWLSGHFGSVHALGLVAVFLFSSAPVRYSTRLLSVHTWLIHSLLFMLIYNS